MVNATSLYSATKHFYCEHAKSFSMTRTQAWEGWHQLVPFFHQYDSIHVLDLGCGNARFADFLSQKITTDWKYTGIDYSKELLAEARIMLSQISQEKNFYNLLHRDVTNTKQLADTLRSKVKKNNVTPLVITLFGVLHHLTKPQRVELLSMLQSFISDKDLIIASYWQPLLSPRIRSQWPEQNGIISIHTSHEGSLGWQTTKAVRSVYQISGEDISLELQKANVRLTACYTADSQEKLNIYTICTL